MALKRLVGEIHTGLGFVGGDQLEVALRMQRGLIQKGLLPERLQREKLVSEARDNGTRTAKPNIIYVSNNHCDRTKKLFH